LISAGASEQCGEIGKETENLLSASLTISAGAGLSIE
jgi:hypothetical protein